MKLLDVNSSLFLIHLGDMELKAFFLAVASNKTQVLGDSGLIKSKVMLWLKESWKRCGECDWSQI